MLAMVSIMSCNIHSTGIGDPLHSEGRECQLGAGMGNRCVGIAGRKKMHYSTRAHIPKHANSAPEARKLGLLSF